MDSKENSTNQRKTSTKTKRASTRKKKPIRKGSAATEQVTFGSCIEERVGRAPKWEDPDAMENEIKKYFNKCKRTQEHPTMAGMALALKFTSVTSLNQYKTRDIRFKDVLDWAKTYIEDYRTKLLIDAKNPTGLIFDLKNNFGWKDRYENQVGMDVDLSKMTDEQLAFIVKTGKLPPGFQD